MYLSAKQVRRIAALVIVLLLALVASFGVGLASVHPLADPYTIGLSSGASTGAAFVVLVLGTTSLGLWTLPVFAFLGALVATLATLMFAGRRPSPAKLILSGLAVGYGFTAITNMLVFSADNPETARGVLFWMHGSLARSSWHDAMICALAALFVVVIVGYFAPALDALGGGDEAAQAVDISPNTTRIGLLIVVSIAVGVAVSASGGIGFVGLVVPHLVRGLLGRSQRPVTLGCVLLGSAFLVGADAIARVALSPVELPIGVITGSVSAPFLFFLVAGRQANPLVTHRLQDWDSALITTRPFSPHPRVNINIVIQSLDNKMATTRNYNNHQGAVNRHPLWQDRYMINVFNVPKAGLGLLERMAV